MKCCGLGSSSSTSTKAEEFHGTEQKKVNHEVLVRVPGCKVYLMSQGDATEIAQGYFSLQRVSDQSLPLATIVKVGDHLQWPLTKDQPIVKLDYCHYLFTLPIKDGDPLNYGVTFSPDQAGTLIALDSFLQEHSCFAHHPSEPIGNKNQINWKEFAPKIEDYNGVLAKAVAGGTGQIVKGIFTISNSYLNQVQKGGEVLLAGATDMKSGMARGQRKGNISEDAQKKNALNKNIRRVRKLSEMTEKMSKAMLDGLGVATGSVMVPLVRSKAGKALLASVPGEVILASLGAVDKILNAAEAAERQALSATSRAAGRMVTNRFGDSAGEATEDVLATAGHCTGTAWNIFKIRKTLYPGSSVTSAVIKASARNNRTRNR